MKTIRSLARRLPSVDLYGAVHRGLRWGHAQLLLRLGSTSPADSAQTRAVLGELSSFLDLCVVHLSLEDRHYHPALERRKAGSAGAISQAHVQHHVALAELRELLCSLPHALLQDTSQATDGGPSSWRGLYLAYADFVAEDLQHMGEEETTVQHQFEELYSAVELQELNERLVADISPTNKLSFLRIMIPAATSEGRLAILGPIQAAIPAGPFQGILAELRPTLPEADFEELTVRLGAGCPSS